MRRLLLLTSAVVFFDTLFFAVLTPLLPHFADTFGLGKTGAGVLAAAYPAGAFVGAIPSGIVAARLGVKPTVIAGLSIVALCTALSSSRRASLRRSGELGARRSASNARCESAYSRTCSTASLLATSPLA